MKLESLASIFNGPWLLQKEWAEKALAILLTLSKNSDLESIAKSLNGEQKPNFIISGAGKVSMTDFSSANDAGSIAVININGPIYREKTDTLISTFKTLKANPNIGGVIAIIGSPGGQAMGLQELEAEIKSLSIPKVAFVNDDLMCSAAYWAGCNFDMIFSGTKTSTVGSIGAYTAFSDTTGLYEKLGIKITEIYAPQSTEKNAMYREALKGNTKPAEDRLSFLTDIFINTVKAARKGRLDMSAGDPFHGADYTAVDATKIGLIDGIKTYDEVVTYVQEQMSAKKNTSHNANSQNTMKIKIKLLAAWSAMATFFGMETGKDHDIETTSDKLGELNAKLTQIPLLESQVQALTNEKDTLQTKLDSAGTEITSLKEKVTKLEKKPGAQSGKTVKQGSATEKIDEEKKDRVLNSWEQKAQKKNERYAVEIVEETEETEE